MIFSLTKSETHAHVLLKEDHRKVDGLFKEFETADDSAEKVRVAREICLELAVHAELEESLYYPSALQAFGKEGDDLVNEARVEHQTLKFLIEQVDGTGAGDELFDANLKVLKEYVKHHVKEEENELFPKVEKETGIDLEALGVRMLERKAELLNALSAKRQGPRNKVSVASLSKSTERRGGVAELSARARGTRSKDAVRTEPRGAAKKSGSTRVRAARAGKARSTRTGRSTGSRSASSSRSGRGTGTQATRTATKRSRAADARKSVARSSGSRTVAKRGSTPKRAATRATAARGAKPGATNRSGTSRLRAYAARRTASKGKSAR